MGTAGVVAEWASTTTLAKRPNFYGRSKTITRCFHAAAALSIALLASGGSVAYQGKSWGIEIMRVGAILLLLVYFALVGFFGFLGYSHSGCGCKPLLWSILIALPILAVPYFYKVVTVIDWKDKELSLTTGKIIYRVLCSALPNATVILTFIIGGMLSRNINTDAKLDRQATIPLTDAYDLPVGPPSNIAPPNPRPAYDRY